VKKYECVMQDGIKDCGICSLLTIIKTYGGNLPKEYLRNMTDTNKNGVTAYSLLEAGRKVGFDTKGVKGDISNLDNNILPCIAHVIIDEKYKHFVVIHKIDKKKNIVTIADPSCGLIKLNIEKFNIISTNTFLIFIPNKTLPIMTTTNQIKNIIIMFLIRNKKILLLVIALSVIYTVFNIITAFNFQVILDTALLINSKNNLLLVSIIMFIFFLFKNVVEYLRNNLLNFISHKLDYTLINKSFGHILSLPHLYYKNRPTGEILSRINDLGEIRDIISHLIVTFFVDFILILFLICFLFSISATITFTILFLLLIYSLMVFIFNKLIYKKIRKIKESESRVNSYMIESINSIDTLKGMNIFEKVFSKFSYLYNSYLNSTYRFNNFDNIKKLLENTIISILTLTIIFVGGNLVIEEKLSIGKLITYNSLIYYFLDPIRNIITFDILLKRTKIVIERLNEMLNIESENLFSDLREIENLNEDIKINNLTYSYPGRKTLLKNISLTIKKGEKVVINGQSGSGKSTLAKIIAKYIPIEKDYVYFGDKDINDYNLWVLRESITYVSQNEFLFTDTVYNNLNIRNTRDYKLVEEVCKKVLVDEFIMKKKVGYNSLIEENASNISGGERQRLILARTFLKESNIYILDESFSEIDVKKERTILKNLFKLFKEKTIIVVSHRYDNNDLYDRIINLEELKNGT